ncbi:MAG TPA: ribosome biogenesis GTPase Der [Candidatus Bipolaricaulota bacterium]|nr:ribosome biogenesis GTPase Der [Candidatus Bipolaricaulota bacterium]
MSKIKHQNPLVVLVGRVNVGKSSLFNKLTETENAIVSNIAGTTRDRQYGDCVWRGKVMTMVDIAGLDVEDPDLIEKQSLIQAEKAIKRADLILFMVNAKEGLLPGDKKYAGMLKKKNKKNIVLVANKTDAARDEVNLSEFYKLGLGEPIAISAASGRGTGDLLDAMLSKMNFKKPAVKETKEKIEKISIGLIGKPNVGKSSLFNQISGEERVIVNERPHTTRDRQMIDIDFSADSGKNYNLRFFDTAGVTKKGKIKGKLEKLGIEQSLDTIREIDVAIFITDCSKKLSVQDKNLAQVIMDEHPSLIIVANKWDLIPEKDEDTQKKYIEYYQSLLPQLKWAPIVFTSAKTGFKVKRLLDMIIQLYEDRKIIIPQRQLDKFLSKMIKKQSPPPKNHITKPAFIYEINQTDINPPTFALIIDKPQDLIFSYRRYLLNNLREEFNLSGSGVKLVLTKRSRQLPKEAILSKNKKLSGKNMTKLIVGLGNPGKEYESTRHNAGFTALDELKKEAQYDFGGWILDKKNQSWLSAGRLDGNKIILAKPQTFMNNSGEAVQKLVKYYNIDLDNLLVIHDDVDFLLGEYKIQKSRSSAGQKGVQSIIDFLGSNDFHRLRLGIAREDKKKMGDTADFVLKKFTMAEKKKFMETVVAAIVDLKNFM